MKHLVLIITICLMACGPNINNPEVQKLYDEVMFVHDEVMPEISTIHKLKKQLKPFKAQDSTVLQLITNLDNSDEAMMDWMAEFGAFRDLEQESKEVKLEYLGKEKVKITKVDQLMRSSIKEAQEYLKSKEQ